MSLPKVSIIICTYNSAKYLYDVLDAIHTQNYPKNLIEIIIIDDNSKDNTVKLAKSYKRKFKHLRVIVKPKRLPKGAAVSTNLGVKLAKGEIVCSIDSDAIISKGWIKTIVAQFKDPKVGSVAGFINTANPEYLPARLVGAELEDRYARIRKKEVDHVSTCNTAYRRSALKKVGGLDPKIYYRDDVDLSYKLKNAGYKILLLKRVGCRHHWKESFRGYLRQQFNVAYGRMQIISRHPTKKAGDKVSGFFMLIQAPLTLLFFIFIALQTLQSYSFFRYSYIAALSTLLLLFLMQLPQAVRLLFFKKDASMLLMPFFNMVRNLMWLVAFFVYNARRIIRSER
jgi:cellulose synthase/poly-beta-1,6-N-acetylglucosamine synthase-like glycosyltransferase